MENIGVSSSDDEAGEDDRGKQTSKDKDIIKSNVLSKQ